jgi:Cu(I)/Ag(I) efflux system membrane fusion protein
MSKNYGAALAVVAAIIAGILIGRTTVDTTGAGPAADGGEAEREILYWVAPMDPNYRRDEPGKSPMGMDLVPVYADEVDSQPGVVRIDPTIVNNLGVRTVGAQRSQLSRRIETVGYVEYDEDTVHHVHTRVDGWIEKLATKATGDPVTRGQLLYEIYSPTLVNAQEEYLAALRSGNAVLLRASRERLASLGVTGSEIERLDKERTVRRLVRAYAEADGVIAHLGAREGIYVTPATEIMSVAKLDTIWVVAEVFERQATWVQEGQDAVVELDYLPGESWQGTVDYVYPELDPKTRTLRVRLRFENPSRRLLPNMFARVTIHVESVGSVVHIPREALIRGGSMDRVVLALGEGRFRSRSVKVGVESGDRVAILQGLAPGDRVVTSAQFLIDSESNIEVALGRMDDEAPMDHGEHGMDHDMPMDHGEHDMDHDMPMDHGEHDMDHDMPMNHGEHEEETTR